MVEQGLSVEKLIVDLEENSQPIREARRAMMDFGKVHPELVGKSWPTLLKSQTFFNHVVEFDKQRRLSLEALGQRPTEIQTCKEGN